jgi:fibronectin type 3 domain-containing protein
MTITINRNLLIAIIIALLLVGIFYLANRAGLVFRRFSATILSSLDGGAVTVPQRISDLVIVAGDEQVSLAWAAPIDGGSKITAYRIYRGESLNNFNFLTAVPRESFTDTGLKNGVTYYYKIAAANIMGEGPMSEAVNALPSIVGLRQTSNVTVQNNNVNSVATYTTSVPSAVNSLAAVAGNNAVSLAWSAPYNGGRQISFFKIYRGTWNGGETYLDSTTASAFTDANVLNNTTYYYRVAAVNALGEGNWSNRVAVTPRPYIGLPGQVTSLSAVPGDSQITLSWLTPANGSAITGYKVYRGTSLNDLSYVTTFTSNSFISSGLLNGQTYYFKVSAMNAVGEGPMSSEAMAVPMYYYSSISDRAPRMISGLSANPGDARIFLSWSVPQSDVAPVSYYKIYRNSNNYGTESFYVTSNANSFTDTSVVNGVTYYYRVSAVNSFGEGDLSYSVSATPYVTYYGGGSVYYPPYNPATIPGQVTNLSATKNTNNYAVLNWTAPYNGGSSIQQYRIYRGTSAGSDSLLANTSSATYTDSGVSTGHTYYYRVKAVNTIGESGWSNQASVTIPTPPSSNTHDHDDEPSYTSAPAEYVNIKSISPSPVVQGNDFSVYWEASSNFIGCRVWFEGGDPNSVKAGLSRSGSTSFPTIGVVAGTYEVAVRCFREREMGLMFDYKEDDYRDKPDSGLRKASNITVVKGASYSCSCTNGTASGGIAKCSDIVSGGTICQYQCSKQGKGNWANSFSCNQ